MIIFLIILTAVPSILFSLFELTCIVTGGTKTSKWWCYWLAWFITIVIILYCLFIIISMFYSMESYNTAMMRITEDDDNSKITKTDANTYAQNLMSIEKDNVTKKPEMRPVVEPVMKPSMEPVMQPTVQNNMQHDMHNDMGAQGYDYADNLATFENTGFPTDMPNHTMTKNINENFNDKNVPEPFANKNIDLLQNISDISLI